jgi:hypothetical protein
MTTIIIVIMTSTGSSKGNNTGKMKERPLAGRSLPRKYLLRRPGRRGRSLEIEYGFSVHGCRVLLTGVACQSANGFHRMG